MSLAITQLEQKISGFSNDDKYLKASFLSRLGSGSASRSLYGPCAIWGYHEDITNSNNEFAIYDSNNYNNVRPIFKEFMEDYSIEPNKNDFNREIELQKIREQNEIMKNYG